VKKKKEGEKPITRIVPVDRPAPKQTNVIEGEKEIFTVNGKPVLKTTVTSLVKGKIT
jgi:hypothetical protein